MAWIRLAKTGELPAGEIIEVEHGGNLYALCNADGDLRALSGVCPHEGGPLGQGGLTKGIVVCPWHMWEFDSRNGACLAREGLRIPTYPVKVEGDNVLVDLPVRDTQVRDSQKDA